MMRCSIFSFLMLAFAYSLQAQTFTENITIQWQSQPRVLNISESEQLFYPHFAGAAYDEAHPQRPIWTKRFDLTEYSRIRVELLQPVFEPVNETIVFKANEISEEIVFEAGTSLQRRRPIGWVNFVPIRYNNLTGKYEQLVSGQLRITTTPTEAPYANQSLRNTTTSQLADGDIFKITVGESGVYKISYSLLQSLGVDVDNIDPRRIQLLGNGGKMLPEIVGEARVDDLMENAIFIQGESDGSFDANDYILFYAVGTKYWTYNSSTDLYYLTNNVYTDSAAYFIKIGTNNGKRIGNQASISGTNYTSAAYDALAHQERDLNNLMEDYYALPSSGRRWVGEPFQITRNRNFSFTFDNRISSEPVKMRSSVLARVMGSSGSLVYSANGTSFSSKSVTTVTGGVYDIYAKEIYSEETFTTSNNDISIGLTFTHPSSTAQAWLDYITLNARCQLVFGNGQLLFRDKESLGQGTATFQLSNANGVTIWDVTDPYNVLVQQTNPSGSTQSFGVSVDTLREFAAFDGSSFKTPNAKGRIGNQNLHGMVTAPNLLLIYHRDFAQAAQQLATHRAAHSGITVELVEIERIYNEFSSGNPDVTAIRDFAKMLYDRETPGNELKYLLLFGDGSFDYKNLNTARGVNTNFVPAFETSQSFDPLLSYTTDDFFGLLDAGEGNTTAEHDIDLGVGRIPVTSGLQAQQVVQKIIDYDTDPVMLDEWRNRTLFICDDQDNNIHLDDIDSIARTASQLDTVYNQDKIYIDAFQQVSTSGGNRYPDANEAILNALYKGNLVLGYMGHGGEGGWAQERIFTTTEIESLENYERLPLFITATCSFAPFDVPDVLSAGEMLLLLPNGGAIALMATARVVYADANERLTRESFNAIIPPLGNSERPTLGDIIRTAKNNTGVENKANSRKFLLLGDPSMTLAYPEHNVVTTSFNGNPIDAIPDTMRALQRITIEGEVRDQQGNLLSGFNGNIYPTVFDKPDTIITRGNDSGSYPTSFSLQKKVIFRGAATVVNGKFSFEFVVPMDINYIMGYGKISYYAENGNTDANGFYTNFVVGGTYPNAVADNVGPEVEVFMNDDKFVSGGITDANPFLFTKLYDENGINTVGNSIGHDLLGQILLTDADQNEYVLNEYYQAAKDDFRRGTATYPLKDLPEGSYTARVKAWDTYNNMGEGSTEFVVTSDASLALQHVLNYPNPFTTHTSFQFEHNFPGRDIEVRVQIFTISGHLLKTIHQTVAAEGYRVDNIDWDGLDDYGDRIGRGVYVYKITVQADGNDGEAQQESEYQKLVILR